MGKIALQKMHQAFSSQHSGIYGGFCEDLFIWSVEQGIKYTLAHLSSINSNTYIFSPQPYTWSIWWTLLKIMWTDHYAQPPNLTLGGSHIRQTTHDFHEWADPTKDPLSGHIMGRSSGLRI